MRNRTISKLTVLVVILGALLLGSAQSPKNTTTTTTTTMTSSNSSTVNIPSDIYLEFDESDIRNLSLRLKWGYTNNNSSSSINSSSSSNASIPTRFVLLMETKRINFSTFLFDYSSPQLIDDEQVVKASAMKAENFKKRVVLYYQSNLDCSMSCINSTRFSTNERSFECNIFYYDSTTRTCVLYEYDFVNEYKKKRVSTADDIYDYFNDECDMDEILGDVVGYSRLCKRILDYRDEHVIKINPYIDYRFSLSVRNQKYEWTPFLRREYQYAPKITIDVKGDVKLGENVTLECKTELSESIVDSITWKNNNPAMKGTLVISPLTIANVHQTYYCEIRFNFFRMIQKAYRLNVTSLGDLKPVLKLNYTMDMENLNVTLNWTVKAPLGSRFKPEKMILLYSENNSTYKFVNKYLLFELSKFDNARLASARDSEDITTTNEDECAMNCLQKSFCDHFVFIRSIEPFRNSRRKNCRLVTNSNDNIFPCRYDLICANLSPFEKHVQNDTINILILPNITYRFKIQLKDKHLNWTDVEETEPIMIPLKMKLEQRGESEITETTNTSSRFELVCQTNINRNVQHQISWMRDDKEIAIDGQLFSTYVTNDTQFANSVLVFRRFLNESIANTNYSGLFKCNIYIRYPEVGQGTSYRSDTKLVQFNFNRPLKYQRTVGNISLPTVPGLLLELNCQISGQPMKSVKWLIDGVDFNDKVSFKQITDDPFVINITDPNDSSIHNILVMKIDTPRKLAKYECILNDEIIVKSHFIEIIDQKPELEYKIDKSKLSRLQLSIDFKLKNNPYVPKYASLTSSNSSSFDTKPLKLFVLYAENSTMESAVRTTIAPNTLSRTDMNWTPSSQSDKIKLGSLKPTQHGIQSCKLVCFNTPFCRAYEYVIYDDSCNFYSDSGTDNYYKSLIERLKSSSTSPPPSSTASNNTTSSSFFNLIHLLQADFFNLVEEKAFSNITLIDRKKYPNCEAKVKPRSRYIVTSSLDDIEDDSCSDQLADYVSPYTLNNLIPLTTYQLRIELVTAFGKSSVYLTEPIQVPFELSLSVTEQSSPQQQYSFKCATTILVSDKLSFIWYKNDQRLIETETTAYQIYAPKTSSNMSLYYSELVLKSDARSSIGYYTCSLVFTSSEQPVTKMAKNESLIFRPYIKPTYSIYADQVLGKTQGDMWTDSCSAQGWPLPSLQWTLNGRPVPNHTADLVSSLPYAISHHRNLTVTAYVIAQNLTAASAAGKYTCWINGQLPIKNVTLNIKTPGGGGGGGGGSSSTDDRSSSDSDKTPVSPSEDANKDSQKSSSKSRFLVGLMATLTVLFGIAAVILFVYYKRKPLNLNTSFAYNPLEEQLTGTGVDNVNLTDDNNQ